MSRTPTPSPDCDNNPVFGEANRIWFRARQLEIDMDLTYNDAAIEAARLIHEVGGETVSRWAIDHGLRPPARQAHYPDFLLALRMMLFRDKDAGDAGIRPILSRYSKVAFVLHHHGVITKAGAQLFFDKHCRGSGASEGHAGKVSNFSEAICARFDKNGELKVISAAAGAEHRTDPEHPDTEETDEITFERGIEYLRSSPPVGRLTLDGNEPPLADFHGVSIVLVRKQEPPAYDVLRDALDGLSRAALRALVIECASDLDEPTETPDAPGNQS